MRDHNVKIKAKFEMLKESFKEKMEYEVQFVVWPIVENGDGDLGIQIYSQDYEMLSMRAFEEGFADGKKTTVNPWKGYDGASID
jgi:hypothetical protein